MAPREKPARRWRQPRLADEPVRLMYPQLGLPPRPEGRILDIPIVPKMSMKAWQEIQAYADRRLVEDKDAQEERTAKRRRVTLAGSPEGGERRMAQGQRSQAHYNTHNLPTPEASSQVVVVIEDGESSDDDNIPFSADMSDSESSEDDEVAEESSSEDIEAEARQASNVQAKKVVIDLTGDDDAGDTGERELSRSFHGLITKIRMKGIDVSKMSKENSPRVSEMSYRPSQRLSKGSPLNPAKRKYTSTNVLSLGTQHDFSNDEGDSRPADYLRPYQYPSRYRESTRASSKGEELAPSIEKDSQGGARRTQDGEVYDVEEVLGEYRIQGKHEFLVRWVDFEKTDWVRAQDCCCPELINEYRKKLAREDVESSSDNSVMEVKAPSFGDMRKTLQRRATSTARFSSAVSVLGDQRVHNVTGVKPKATLHAVESDQATKKRKRAENDGSDKRGPYVEEFTKEESQSAMPAKQNSRVAAQEHSLSNFENHVKFKILRGRSLPVLHNRHFPDIATGSAEPSIYEPKPVIHTIQTRLPSKLGGFARKAECGVRRDIHSPFSSQNVFVDLGIGKKFMSDPSVRNAVCSEAPDRSRQQQEQANVREPTSPERSRVPFVLQELQLECQHPSEKEKGNEVRRWILNVNTTPLGSRPRQPRFEYPSEASFAPRASDTTQKALQVDTAANSNRRMDPSKKSDSEEIKSLLHQPNNNNPRANFEVSKDLKDELRYVNGHRRQLRGG